MYSKEWMEWAQELGREYFARSPETFERYIEANGFSAEHEKAIRESVVE